MRSSQVAPVPMNNDESCRNSAKAGAPKSPISGTKRVLRKDSSEEGSPSRKQRLLTTANRNTELPMVYDKPYLMSALDPLPPALVSSSTSTEDDTTDPADDDVENAYRYSLPHVERSDDHSQPSTDDPYTYSDDSVSLSDAYFLQQSSPEISVHHASHVPTAHLGPLPIVPSIGNDRNSRSLWAGPPWIQADDPRPGKKQAQSNAIEEEEPITETTGLLTKNNGGRRPQYQRNRRKSDEKKKPKRNSYETMNNGAKETIVNSDAHKRHREKHQLRNYHRNLLMRQHQERQEQRERAVSEVRGQLQPLSLKKDRFWSILFILQLIAVCACAVKYGLTIFPTPTKVVRGVPSSLSSSPSFASKTENSSPKMKAQPASSMLVMDEYSSQNDDRPFTVRASLDVTSNNDDGDVTMHTSSFKSNIRDKAFTIDYKNVLSILMISGMYACVTSYLSFAFILILARSIIPIMLVFTILLLFSWGVFGLSMNTHTGSILSLGGFTVFAMSCAYTIANWNHIPFCSTNLFAAICAMRSSVGIVLVGIASLFVGLLWLFIWTVALIGIFNQNNSADCEALGACETHVYISRGEIIEFGLLMVSLYWTTMVIKNIVRVAVAGAIGGPWWFGALSNDLDGNDEPKEDCGCCHSSIVSESLARACTGSLGTICFGSLVDLPAQVLSKIVTCMCWMVGSPSDDFYPVSISGNNQQRAQTTLLGGLDDEENRDDSEHLFPSSPGKARTIDNDSDAESGAQQDYGSPGCYENLKTSLHRLDRGLQYYNRWSYIYIGMYNYSFCEGGEKAIQLFETREWMDIARDTLIQNIFFMASIVIGGSVGIMAVLVEEVDGYEFTSLHKPITTSFLIGFFSGFILSNILLLGLAGAAVNTILVCFAAEPFAFDRNHPHLSGEMREVWSQLVWEPDEIGRR